MVSNPVLGVYVQASAEDFIRMRAAYSDIDHKTKLLQKKVSDNKDLSRSFYERFEISWIYHENALDGAVLDVFDLKAALEHSNLEEGILIPTYQRIRNHKAAIEKVRAASENGGKPPTLSFIKQLHQVLVFGIADRAGGVYRKDTPIHRAYFHEIAPPGKISALMNKLVRDMKAKEFKQHHPIRQAAEVHFRMMYIFPFDDESGKVARMLMNYFVLRAGYFPIVIPDFERQRYYDGLRFSSQVLHALIIESIERTLDTAMRYFDEGGRENW